MDKRKLLLYGGVGAAALGTFWLLTRTPAKAVASEAYASPMPTVLMGGSYGTAMNPSTSYPDGTLPGNSVDVGDTIEGALALAFEQMRLSTQEHYADNSTALFANVSANLGSLGGGQVVGQTQFDSQGNAFLNVITTLFNPPDRSPTPVAPPPLPQPAPPPAQIVRPVETARPCCPQTLLPHPQSGQLIDPQGVGHWDAISMWGCVPCTPPPMPSGDGGGGG